MNDRARGRFDVKLSPQAMADPAAGATLGRLSIAKEHFYDLEYELIPPS